MRGSGSGTITISGIPGGATITKAFLYWAVLDDASDPSFDDGVFESTSIVGTPIGTDNDPCWGGTTTTYAFRSDVTSLVSGNGNYSLSGFASGPAAPTTGYGEATTPPLSEGASLVVLFTDPLATENRHIVVYDGADTIDSAVASVSTTLTVPPIGTLGTAKTTYVVADGQDQYSDDTVFNAAIIASDAATLGDTTSFEGSDGGLWDTDTYDVTALVSAGDTSVTAKLQKGSDCLVHIAHVFSAPAHQFPPAGRERDSLECLASSASVDSNGDGTLDTVVPNLSFSGEIVVERGDPGDGNDVDPFFPIDGPPHRDAGSEPDGLTDIATEIVQMELTGTSALFGPLTLRAGSDFGLSTSAGAIEEQAAGTGFPADSFFDVFAELTGTPYGPLTTAGPVHYEGIINAIPAFNDVFQALGDMELKDQFGITRIALTGGSCVPGLPVGGIVELRSAPSDSPQGEGGGSGSSAPIYAALAGVAAAVVAVAAGGWYARRRWLR